MVALSWLQKNAQPGRGYSPLWLVTLAESVKKRNF